MLMIKLNDFFALTIFNDDRLLELVVVAAVLVGVVKPSYQLPTGERYWEQNGHLK